MTAFEDIPAGARVVASFAASALALQALGSLFEGADPIPFAWWLARALGFVAYGALWASILSGLAMSAKGGGLFDLKWVLDIHQETTLMAVIASVMHATVMVVDSASGVSPLAVLVPFASARLTGPVTIGTLALLGLGVVALTSWMRARVGVKVWRAVHAAAFGVWLLGLLHGVYAGSTNGALVSLIYVASGGLVAGAMAWRVAMTAAQAEAGS